MDLELVPVVAVVGDPPVVRAAADAYGGVADQIRSAAAALRVLADTASGESQTVDQLRSNARAVASKVSKAEQRYRTVSGALSTYATTLDLVVQDGEDARVRAVAAREDYEQAEVLQAHWQQEASPVRVDTSWGAGADSSGGDDDAAHAQSQVVRFTGQADAALVRFRAAMGDVDAARRRQVTAAATAATTIAGVHDDGLDDSVWNDLAGVVHTVGHVLNAYVVQPVVGAAVWAWNHVDTIAGYLAIASLVLGWIPVVGQILDAVTLVVGLVAVIKAGIGVGMAYAHHQDTTHAWDELGITALGVATLGAGRVASKGIELAYDASKAAKGVKATEMVEDGMKAAKTGSTATKTAEAADDTVKAADHAADTSKAVVDGANTSTETVEALATPSTLRELAGSLKFWEDFKGVKILTKWSTGNPVDTLGAPEAIGDALKQGVHQFKPSTWTFSLNGMAKDYAMTQAAGTTAAGRWMLGLGADKIIDLGVKGHEISDLTVGGE